MSEAGKKKRKVNRTHLEPREREFFSRISDGLFVSQTGRFGAIRLNPFDWEMTDQKTKQIYRAGMKRLLTKQALQILDAEAAAVAPVVVAPPEPPKPDRPAAPEPPMRQLALLRPPRVRLENVVLMEIEGRQFVVGFDASNKAHTLWTEER